MLVPIFSIKLNNKILARTVAIGRYDGLHPCITGASLAGKVFIHNPHKKYHFMGTGRNETLSFDSDVSLLNINAVVTSLETGMLDASNKNESLLIGTSTSVLAYDVNNNTDLFYKEMADGANAIAIGSLGSFSEPVAVIGGNCAITAINKTGEEVLWTVTGDNVSALSLFDFNNSGQNELIVGSEDSDLRVFRHDEIIAEMSETAPIIAISPLQSTRFGYALANGSIGVYEKNVRLWRIKSRNLAMAITSFDINLDGVPELITGWSDGKVDAKSDRNGEVVFKCNLDHSIAGVLHCDYKLDGNEVLLCCSTEGEIKGFKATSSESMAMISDRNLNQDTIRDMSQRKQNLLLELKNLREASEPSVPGKLDDMTGIHSTGIPSNTQVLTAMYTHFKTDTRPGYVELDLKTNNETVIRSVVIFAEGIFKGECHVAHPPANKVSSSLSVPLFIPRDIGVDLHIQTLVGYENASQYHVFDLTRPLATFSMYKMIDAATIEEPKGYVTFLVNERIPRIIMWINNNFILTEDFVCDGIINLAFTALRTNRPLVIRMEATGQLTFKVDDIELAGNLIQSLVAYLNVIDLQISCDFPEEFANLQEVLLKIDQFHNVRQQLTAQMADHSNLIRNLIVRAEDARLMGEISGMKRNYAELMNMNRDLINGYKIRSTNHEELLKNVKGLNSTIQKAANLRAGKYKTEVINNCRQAIKSNNSNLLFKIIRTGVA